MVNQTFKKIITPDLALKKAAKYCAYQERSQQELRDKLYSWGLFRKDVEDILATLIAEGFVKEERFAIAFAQGKLRMKRWGKMLIRKALQEKKISEPLIRQALASLETKEYRKALKELLMKRKNVVRETNPFRKKYKLASYAISRGFERELVWDELGLQEE